MTASAIFESVVSHRRFQPMRHELRYAVWSLLVDLDELEDLTARIPILSRNRWNLVAFWDRDHGPRDGTDLRAWFHDIVRRKAGIDLAGGSVRLLAFPRILGYTFNPITVWFGHDREGELRAVMYEVHNTFGHARSHLAIVPGGSRGRLARHEFDKVLHVSPFFDRSGRYRMSLLPPEDAYDLVIEYLDDDGSRLLTAAQRGTRTRLTTATLLRQFVTKPLVTLKVIGGIHWEAVKLFTKGAKYRSVPPPPSIDDVAVTYVDLPDRSDVPAAGSAVAAVQ